MVCGCKECMKFDMKFVGWKDGNLVRTAPSGISQGTIKLLSEEHAELPYWELVEERITLKVPTATSKDSIFETDNLKIFVAIPYLKMGNDCEKYLSEAIRTINNQDTTVEMLPVRLEGKGGRKDSIKTRIAKSLNFLVDEFLRTDATHFFTGNADNTYPEDTINRLIRHNVDVASGISPIHADWNKTTVAVEKKTSGLDWLRRSDIIGRVIGENEIVSTGEFCSLAKRRVFEKYYSCQDALRWRTRKDKRIPYSYDLQFWIDAWLMGFETRIDGNVVCGHLPEFPLDFEGYPDTMHDKIRDIKWKSFGV